MQGLGVGTLLVAVVGLALAARSFAEFLGLGGVVLSTVFTEGAAIFLPAVPLKLVRPILAARTLSGRGFFTPMVIILATVVAQPCVAVCRGSVGFFCHWRHRRRRSCRWFWRRHDNRCTQ